MKSKAYHARCEYSVLKGSNNEIKLKSPSGGGRHIPTDSLVFIKKDGVAKKPNPPKNLQAEQVESTEEENESEDEDDHEIRIAKLEQQVKKLLIVVDKQQQVIQKLKNL